MANRPNLAHVCFCMGSKLRTVFKFFKWLKKRKVFNDTFHNENYMKFKSCCPKLYIRRLYIRRLCVCNYKKLTYAVTEAEKSHDRLSANWRHKRIDSVSSSLSTEEQCPNWKTSRECEFTFTPPFFPI